MGNEEHKLSTVAETNATLGSPQTETVDPGTPKVKKAKDKKLPPLVTVGSSEEAVPGQTHVQETTIPLGGASRRGGTVGSTITGRKFKDRNLGVTFGGHQAHRDSR